MPRCLVFREDADNGVLGVVHVDNVGVAAKFFKDVYKGFTAVKAPDMTEVDVDLSCNKAVTNVLGLLGITGIEVAVFQCRNC